MNNETNSQKEDHILNSENEEVVNFSKRKKLSPHHLISKRATTSIIDKNFIFPDHPILKTEWKINTRKCIDSSPIITQSGQGE